MVEFKCRVWMLEKSMASSHSSKIALSFRGEISELAHSLQLPGKNELAAKNHATLSQALWRESGPCVRHISSEPYPSTESI